MKRAFGIVLCCLAVCMALVSCGSDQLAPGGSSAAGVRGSEPIGSDEVASEAVAAAADDGNAVASEADPAAAPDFASESDSPIDAAPHGHGAI